MTTTRRAARSAHFGMGLWALIVGLSFPAVGSMSDGLPPLLLTALRFAIAALAMLPMVWALGERWPGVRALGLYAVMGLCLAGFFGGMFWAAERTSALSMAALYVSVPLLAYAFGRTIRVEPRSPRLLAILGLGGFGALALALAESGGAGGLRVGAAEGVFFLGCVGSALYPVLSKWGLSRGLLSPNAALRTLWSLLAGGVLIAGLGLASERAAALGALSWTDAALLAYLGVVSSGATFWLLQRATAVLTPGAVTAYTYLVPFASMLLLLVEAPHRLGWHWLPGVLAVLAAICLLLRRDAAAAGPTAAPTPIATAKQEIEPCN